MNRSESIGKLSLALSKAQGMIKGALKDSANPFFKSKYADLESVWEAARVPLSTNELAVIQLSDETDKGIIVDTILSHSSGEWISGRMFIPIPTKLDAQTVGSACTYARRYSLQMIVGIAPIDDDGNAAVGHSDKKEQPAKAISLHTAETKPDNHEVIPKTNQTLHDELAAWCKGDETTMNTLLKRLSHYEADGKEYFFTLDRLPKTSEKWAGKVLAGLRKMISDDTQSLQEQSQEAA